MAKLQLRKKIPITQTELTQDSTRVGVRGQNSVSLKSVKSSCNVQRLNLPGAGGYEKFPTQWNSASTRGFYTNAKVSEISPRQLHNANGSSLSSTGTGNSSANSSCSTENVKTLWNAKFASGKGISFGQKIHTYDSPIANKHKVLDVSGSPRGAIMAIPIKASFVLLNSTRFEVHCPYNVDVIGIFKTIPSKVYNSLNRTWNFSLQDYDRLVFALSGLKIGIKVEGITARVLSILKEINEKPKQTLEDVDMKDIDEKLLRALMPFQKEGVLFGIQHHGRVLVADDMGLGKTLEAIGIACYYKAEWPVLIFSPSSVRMTWMEAFTTWVPSLNSSEINVVLTGKDDPTCGTINIISYDLIPKHLHNLKAKSFRVIIADESHFIKNIKAARTKAAMELLKGSSRVILLSGTPALSRPQELFTQISAVNSKLFPYFSQFGLRYCDAKQNKFGWDYSGSSNAEELKIILENKIMIRRLKTDVLHQLPEKRRQLVFLDPSLINIKEIQKVAKKVADTNMGKLCDPSFRGPLLEYFCVSCDVKTKAVLAYVADLLENRRKFLIFGHHQNMLNAICDQLTKMKIGFIRIDGRCSSSDRLESVKKFQENEECLVAVLSIMAANMGITLTAASTVIFAELYWNPGALIQAEDRVYRIGQKNAVTIVYLLAKKTADDYIWPLVQGKLAVLTNTGLGQNECSEAEISTFKYKDPKQKQILDYFQQLMEDNIDLDDSQDEEEPPGKKPKIEQFN